MCLPTALDARATNVNPPIPPSRMVRLTERKEMRMLGRRTAVVAVIVGATAFSGGAFAATHGTTHHQAKPKPAKKAPVLNQHLGRHHCNLSSGAGQAGSV